MTHKQKLLNKLTDKFQSLKEQEQNCFSKIVNKLFQVNYLTMQKLEDANDYRFVLLYQEIFDSFFQLVDFELEIKKSDEVLFIRHLNHINKLKLKKEESLILLIFRILFQNKKEQLPFHSKVEVHLQDVYEELNKIGYNEIKKLTKEKMKKTLMLFRQYNIVDYLGNHNYLPDDLIIKIYPSILYLIDFDIIKQYKDLLLSN